MFNALSFPTPTLQCNAKYYLKDLNKYIQCLIFVAIATWVLCTVPCINEAFDLEWLKIIYNYIFVEALKCPFSLFIGKQVRKNG